VHQKRAFVGRAVPASSERAYRNAPQCYQRVNGAVCRNGCATSEDMLWKLEALQTFVFDLHWPDEVFGEHINQRLRTLSTEMIEAAANRCVNPSTSSIRFDVDRRLNAAS